MLNKSTKSKKKEETYLILLAILLVTVILFLGATLLKQGTGPLHLSNTADISEYRASQLLIPSETAKLKQMAADRLIGTSMENVFINSTINFPNGSTPGNVRIENKSTNPYGIKVEVIRTDNGDTIMTTGLIDPGYFVEYRTLDTNLSKGMYICVARFTMYDLETYVSIGEATTQVVAIVKA